MSLQSAEKPTHPALSSDRRPSKFPEFPLRWPVKLLGPVPGLPEINLVCWGLCIGVLLVPMGIVLALRLLHVPSCDFVYFYGIGRLFRTHSPENLYNLSLQLRTFNDIAPPPQGGTYGPSPYPPFVAQFFSLFTHLSFRLAYLLWLLISLALYLKGAFLIAKFAFPARKLERSLTYCFALAFPPFILHTLVNGQLASVAFCFVCMAFILEQRRRPVFSGLALSVLAYKPTLLLLLLPMLVITRRFKALLGFLAGLTLLCLEAMLAAGPRVWAVYLHFLSAFKQLSVRDEHIGLRHWQFIDLNSLSHAIPDGRTPIALAVLSAAAIAILACMGYFLWTSKSADPPAQTLAWAVVLTWTLLLNVYVPTYDSVLVVISLILTLGALRELEWTNAERWVLLISLLVFATSWITEPVAKRFAVQPLTVLLFVFGILQLYILHQAANAHRAEPVSIPISGNI